MRPGIFGILNITEDSFSDGAKYLKPEDALQHADHLMASGADVLDIGPASSHPDAKKVSAEVEISRLAPVLDVLLPKGVPVSVDSYLTETQRYGIERGVAYLNDIQGFADPAIYPELAAAPQKLIVMHSVQGRGPATRVATDAGGILDRISVFFDERLGALKAAGVDESRFILDPGMGFFLGSDPEPSFAVLRGLEVLKRRFGLPVFVSVSRKSFLRRITGRAVGEIGPATLAAELFAAQSGADFIRTHDARALRDGLSVWEALAGTGGA